MRFHYALFVLAPLVSAQVVSEASSGVNSVASTASADVNSVLTDASSAVNSVASTASADVNSVLTAASSAVNSVLSGASSVLVGAAAPGIHGAPMWLGGPRGDVWGLGLGAVVAAGLLGGGLFL